MTDVIHPSTVESPETYLQFGDRYRNSDNIPLALKNYQRALAINPEFAPAHERIGTIHQQQGNAMEAIASFSQAVHFDPTSLGAQLGLGNVYQQMGWAELAITHFQKALEFHPDRFLAEYHCKLGDSLKERGKIAEALISYERAIATNPDYADGYRAIALVYLRQNDPESVQTIYERADARNSELLQSKDYNALGVAWMFKFNALSADGKYSVNDCVDNAIDCFQKAIQLDSAYADAHCNLGSAFIRKDQIKDAIIAYKEALDIDPNFSQPYFNLGILLNNIGKIDEAIACFQSAIEIVPDWVEAHQYLGKLLSRDS
ncbi:MAG: tetratricopeptide repeat protein [Pseudanabaena sp.]|jgi:tetratricopeptide (TPR) repeat protein|nr:tetratricopeptide repeat protein [Chitinophagaceae bacterium]MCA6510548.1 tetratricopeptide repeat protein [Pseudanabaena sp. M109S1SP2A07QC]MCA6519246.1 tetratricopeptide repeat protein [Pseudanabaena sp. M110S1SP2A07QC]MCA6527010.1 tetratricopeptide repeat protein [Pseudanabaena sp. M179S2SP2A07QC]MCA6532075.1 tetratricopeptide repeat protein [Pseudanabaena sp. M125S2SP2A07QC]MCA6536995.1 tetratricopeptide repeat protein [Pseudanabaena sp. M176S2SP2A07QC]MCA6541639.1 tetratricopeptide re